MVARLLGHAGMSISVFLSTVSDEFRAYRDQLRSDLTRHNVEVKVQEDFRDLGGETLDKLDVYIAHCNAVVHLVGDMTGAYPGERGLSALLAKYPDLLTKWPPLSAALKDGVGVSYTQWEAWLALYHGKLLLIARAAKTAERGPKYRPTEASCIAQDAHLARLRALERYPGCTFTSADNLAKYVLGGAILDLLAASQKPLDEPASRKVYSLNYKLLEDTEIKPELVIKSLSYGEGTRSELIINDRLIVLPKEVKLSGEDLGGGNDSATRRLFDLYLKEIKDPASRDKEIYVPHVVLVRGERPEKYKNLPVLVHVCTDIPYKQQTDYQPSGSFEARCLIDTGGIAPFVDERGNFHKKIRRRVKKDVGCAAAIVAVAYAEGSPLFRSEYILVVRKGIRYPDDVWRSRKGNGPPICSVPVNCENSDLRNGGRFIFESREPDGASTDVFVADYNGDNMCNLNAGEPSAWDGFHENGNEVACWTPDGKIRFCTRAPGYPSIVVRPDCVRRCQPEE
jgi:hypothetical protein